MSRGRLCAEHRDGLDGALLGILDFTKVCRPHEAHQNIHCQKGRRKSKRRSSAWDTRNAAAAKTTPMRLEPDPARACPAPSAESDVIL
jgi:hypothetical protein